MSATDELRRMLDERGVEWDADDEVMDDGSLSQVTYWHCNGIEWSADGRDEYLAFDAVQLLTPAQAIAATLGAGTLTAKQVMAIAGRHQPDYCSDTHVCFDWQAIADELNATMGSADLAAENAKLREEFNKMDVWHSKELTAAMDENAKLRELCADMHAVISDRNSWWDCMRKDTRRFTDRMRKLGIEVD